MNRAVAVAAVSVASIVGGSISVRAVAAASAVPEARVKLTHLLSFTRGTAIATRSSDPSIYVARQTGRVMAVSGPYLEPFVLDLSSRVSQRREQGLLGLAFSPAGDKLYVYFTDLDNRTVLEEYGVRTSHRHPWVRADRQTRRVLFAWDHPTHEHNGGQLAFGPDGMLYVSIGDGGGHKAIGPAQVPGGNAQALDSPLGKILRLDPRAVGDAPYTIPAGNPFASGPQPEIWMYGLRNPWRFSFDRLTRDVWIGEVGEDHWDEIDTVPFARAAGSNFGWPLLEGTAPMRATSAPSTVLPVEALWHRAGYCAVTGGYVYRGQAIPELRGVYVFADYCRLDLRALVVRDGKVVSFTRLGVKLPLVSSFGEDANGELYVLSQSDGLFRLDRSNREALLSCATRN